VCFSFGQPKASQPDLIYLQNQQALLARMATHNQKKIKENPCLLGQELSTRNQEIILIKMTYLNNYMLAENGMYEKQ
jgi:hypothetical protein